MTSAMATPGPLVYSDGPVLLAIGSEDAITTWEILGHAFAERIPLNELTTGLSRLKIAGSLPDTAVASLFVNDAAPGPGLSGSGQEAHNPAERSLVVEACAVYWRLRMQDIGDAGQGMRQSAVDTLGRFSFSGQPLLNELHARRRGEPAADAAEIGELREVVDSLRDRVAFGAAGLAAAAPDTLPELLKKALAPDGWAWQIALLVAAEEVLATDILAQVRSPEHHNATESRDVVTDLLVGMLKNRREDLRLVAGLTELQQQLEEYDPSLLQKLRHQATIKRLIQVTQLYTPFLNMRRGSGSEDVAAEAPVTTGEKSPVKFNEEALAAAYGEHFEKMLAPAIENIGELKNAYPRDGIKGLEDRLHRKFLDQASGQVIDDDSAAVDLMDFVALHAMSLAILREVPVDNPEKRRKQAANLARAVKGTELTQRLVDSPAFAEALRIAETRLISFLLSYLGESTPPGKRWQQAIPVALPWVKGLMAGKTPDGSAAYALRFLHGTPLKLLAFTIRQSIR